MDSKKINVASFSIADGTSRLFTKIIGTKIRQVREERGLSIKNFANSIGVGITTVSELEKGYNFPKLETVLHITCSLGIEIGCVADMLREARNRYVHMDINMLEELQEDKVSQSKSEILDTSEEVNEEILHLDTILTANLNSTGVNMVKEFVNFIASQPKYQSRSAYSKKKKVKD